MRKLGPLLIAIPSMALGSFLTATLTTTANASPVKPTVTWEYKAVYESDLNRLGAVGWEYCGESAAVTDAGYRIDRQYTLRRRR